MLYYVDGCKFFLVLVLISRIINFFCREGIECREWGWGDRRRWGNFLVYIGIFEGRIGIEFGVVDFLFSVEFMVVERFGGVFGYSCLYFIVKYSEFLTGDIRIFLFDF